MQKLMIEMAIKVTPTFCIFPRQGDRQEGDCISEDNLKSAIAEELSNVEKHPELAASSR